MYIADDISRFKIETYRGNFMARCVTDFDWSTEQTSWNHVIPFTGKFWKTWQVVMKNLIFLEIVPNSKSKMEEKNISGCNSN